MKRFLKGRADRDAHRFFMTTYGPAIVGKLLWKQRMRQGQNVETLWTVSDEAFGKLVLENKWDYYVDLLEKHDGVYQTQSRIKKKEERIKSYVKGKYTDDRKAKDGYGFEALQRFNELYESFVDLSYYEEHCWT